MDADVVKRINCKFYVDDLTTRVTTAVERNDLCKKLKIRFRLPSLIFVNYAL